MMIFLFSCLYEGTYRAMQRHLAGEQRHVVVGHGHVLRVQVRQELGADALVLGLQQHAVHAVLVRLHHHDAQVELALASRDLNQYNIRAHTCNSARRTKNMCEHRATVQWMISDVNKSEILLADFNAHNTYKCSIL